MEAAIDCVSPYIFYVEILTHDVSILGGRAFGRWLEHMSEVHSRVVPFTKRRPQRALSALWHMSKEGGSYLQNRNQDPFTHPIC